MIHRSVIFFLGICPIIPAAAHLADGLLFIAEFWFLFAAGILSNKLSDYFQFNKQAPVISCFAVISAAALYVQVLGCIFPVMVVGIEFYMYIFACSYIVSISIGRYRDDSEVLEIPVAYSILLLAISIFRELAVFGTVSLPMPSGVFTVRLIPFETPLAFWGSNAGVLIVLGISWWLFYSVQKGELVSLQTDKSRRNRL